MLAYDEQTLGVVNAWRSPRGRPAQLMNDSEECVDDVNAQLDKLCASLRRACFTQGRCVLTALRAAVSSCACSGYNIGMRLVDEYFAKTGAVRAASRRRARAAADARACEQGRCADFRDAAEAVAKARCSRRLSDIMDRMLS